MPDKIVWLSSLGASSRYEKNKLFLNEESLSNFVIQCLEELPGGDATAHVCLASHVFGLARLRLSRVYHTLAILSRPEREQIDFWQTALEVDLSGQAYFWTVVDSCMLDAPKPLQHLTERNFRGSQ